jgi:hypothetical protein
LVAVSRRAFARSGRWLSNLGRRLVMGRQVGAGGMGRVYEAHDEESGRKLAVRR